LDESSVEVSVSGVQLSAVLDILVNVTVVVSVLLSELSEGEAATSRFDGSADGGLVEVSQGHSNLWGDQRIVFDLVEGVNQIGTTIVALKLDDVGSIGTFSTLTGETVVLGIRASPLEVNVVSTSNTKVGRYEVILNGGVGLDNVTTTTADVQVEDTGGTSDSERTGLDPEGVRAVLKGTTILVSVQCQGQVAHFVGLVVTKGDTRVALNGGLLSVILAVNHIGILGINVIPTIVVTRGNVVTKAEDASSTLNIISNLRIVPDRGGESPQVTSSGSTEISVTKMVITSQRMRDALRVWEIPAGDFDPIALWVVGVDAVLLVVLLSTVTPDAGDGNGLLKVEGGGGTRDTVTLGHSVLRVGVVVRAASSDGARGQDGNILPWGRMPVRIVVTLLVTFPTTTTTVVLASLSGLVTDVLVGDEQALVTLTAIAITPEVGRLVLNEVSIVIIIVGRGVVVGTITDPRATHVLENNLAISVRMASTTTVLGGPFDLEERALVVGHFGTPAITTIVVVLGVKGTILVVGITTITVVGTTRVVHVNVGKSQAKDGQEDHKDGGTSHS